MVRHHVRFAVFLVLALPLGMGACTAAKPPMDRPAWQAGLREELVQGLSSPRLRLAPYGADFSLPLADRVGPAPKMVLDYWAAMDEVKGYTSRRLSPGEKALVRGALEKLPPLHRKVLRERLMGLYFVEDFRGSGVTDWVFDDAGRLYVYIALNAATLDTGISEWVTKKERTAFGEEEEGFSVGVNLGDALKGVDYILLHEATHAVDYVRRLTPYVEPVLEEIQGQGGTVFTGGVWEAYGQPVPGFRYPHREKVSFYGFRDGPHLYARHAVALYDGLLATPFVSLYGSLSWAEDLAELLAFYHLTQKLGQPYAIELREHGAVVKTFSPMDNPLVRRRFDALQVFYEEE